MHLSTLTVCYMELIECLCSLLMISVVYHRLNSGDNMNFISKFDIAKHQVTVEMEEPTVICSCNESGGVAGVRMKQAMQEKWNYFEVLITRTVEAGEIGIGLGHNNYALSKMPGWGNHSIGYHADDGGLYHENGVAQLHGPTCMIGDRMGCGVDFTPTADGHVRVWFTKNDQVVFYPETLDLPVNSESKFYPLICMRGSGQQVQYLGHWPKPHPTEKVGKPIAAILYTTTGIFA